MAKTTTVNVWHNLMIEHEVFEKVQEVKTTESGGTIKTWHSVSEGHERVWCSLNCDWSALQSMFHTAARNKSGKSQDGAFTAIVERRGESTNANKQRHNL